MNSQIVINTGPLIAFGRMDCLETIRHLPIDFSSPEQVRHEIAAGNRLGYAITFPEWINVITLTDPPSKLTLSNLDAGEAAVIEAALQNNIPSDRLYRRAKRTPCRDRVGVVCRWLTRPFGTRKKERSNFRGQAIRGKGSAIRHSL